MPPRIAMPINEKLMRALKKQYGEEKGERMYYAMENKGNPATKPKAVAKSKRESAIARAMKGK